MSSHLAAAICWLGIAGLFYLDRDKMARTSKALWLPVLWLGIVGSRPISIWLGIEPPPNVNVQLEGSPVDRFVFQVLLAAGVIVLIGRRKKTRSLLKTSWPALLYFTYCLASVIWSPFPDVAFKRWIKAIGDLVMVLVVVTDPDPIAALRRLISRTGFVLLPLSVLFIRYFGDLGRGYTPDGGPMNTGVTTNKNTLGLITFVITLGTLWNVWTLFCRKDAPGRGRHLLAQGTLLAIGIVVLVMAQSATSIACFAIGAALILATNLLVVRRSPGVVHALVLMMILGGGLTMFFGAGGSLVHALGRQTNFTGRTEIWAAVLPAVPNSVVGAGFESFWIGPWLNDVYHGLSQYMHVNEAHNGYIEVYLNLGWVGVGLLGVILLSGYLHAISVFRRDPSLGSLMLAYIVVGSIYSVTEAGFRMLLPMWIFILLAFVAAGGIVSAGLSKAPEVLGEVPVHCLGDLRASHPNALDQPWNDK